MQILETAWKLEKNVFGFLDNRVWIDRGKI